MTRTSMARFTALALATGTLVVASGTAPASAATTTERVFDATGGGAVLRLEINLPAGVPGVLPQKIVQDIVLANGAARTGDTVAALGNAFIGQSGNVPLIQDLLGGSAQTTLAKPAAEYSLLKLPDNPLGLTGGVLHAVSNVAAPTGDGLLSSNSSSIASLQLKGGGALGAVLAPVQAALQNALGAAAGTSTAGSGTAGSGTAAGGSPVAPVTTTVTGVLNTALDALDDVTSDATAPVTDAVRQAVQLVTDAINELLADLTGQVSSLSDADALLDVGLLQTTQKVTRLGQTVTSEAANKLVGVDVLGGLIHVDGIESRAVASLGPSASSSDATATLLKANVGDLLSVTLTDKLEALLGGQVGSALPADVLGTVNGALAQVTGLLAETLGLQTPLQAKTSKSASADESSATVEAAALVLDPLRNPAAPLLRIGFVPAEAKVKAQSITSTVISPQAPVSLPRTGGELPLTGAVATVLVGVALMARRRRAALPQ